jgi:hypothetical protein
MKMVNLISMNKVDDDMEVPSPIRLDEEEWVGCIVLKRL